MLLSASRFWQIESLYRANAKYQPEWVPRFVCFRADGHGQAMPLSGSAELVRGRSPRLVIQVILPRPEAQALLARLRSAIPNPEVAYWIADLAEAGRLA